MSKVQSNYIRAIFVTSEKDAELVFVNCDFFTFFCIFINSNTENITI